MLTPPEIGGKSRSRLTPIFGAGVAVITKSIDSDVYASSIWRCRITDSRISGAGVAVHALLCECAGTYTVRARIAVQARVFVVAGVSVINPHATSTRHARVSRALILVVAHHRDCAFLARAVGARIPSRAFVAIITGSGIIGVNTPLGGKTGVIRALILVVTSDSRAGGTDTTFASVICRARISIFTRRATQIDIEAAFVSETGIIRAVEAIYAHHIVWCVSATSCQVASVYGALESIIAGFGRAHARPILADVIGAQIVVGARCRAWRVLATRKRVADVVGARVVVIAVDRFSRDTRPVCTDVVVGAGIAIVAGTGQLDVNTALAGDTGIIRTLVLVITRAVVRGV